VGVVGGPIPRALQVVRDNGYQLGSSTFYYRRPGEGTLRIDKLAQRNPGKSVAAAQAESEDYPRVPLNFVVSLSLDCGILTVADFEKGGKDSSGSLSRYPRLLGTERLRGQGKGGSLAQGSGGRCQDRPVDRASGDLGSGFGEVAFKRGQRLGA
jgi:hypothetical protein